MIRTHKPKTTRLLSLVISVTVLGCSENNTGANTAEECKKTGTCSGENDSGGAGKSGGSTSKGGDASVTVNGGSTSPTTRGGTSSTTARSGSSNAPSGGTSATSAAAAGSSSAIGGTSSSTAAAGSTAILRECRFTCTDATPYCDTSTGSCVGCLSDTDCAEADPSIPFCSASNTCVQCQAHTDCNNPNASVCNIVENRCEPCSVDADCSHIDGKHVCYERSCVQCSGKNYQACGSLDGAPLVCDRLKRECSKDKMAHSKSLCEECVSDAQCLPGQFCLPQRYNNVYRGYYCFWRQGANGAPTKCMSEEARPYVAASTNPSIDDATGTFCTLAVSNCVAMNQFRNKDCLFNGAADNMLCGLVPGKDSKCAAFGASGDRCTVACEGDYDCMPKFSCLPDGALKFCALDQS